MAAGPRDKVGRALEDRDRRYAEAWKAVVARYKEVRYSDDTMEVLSALETMIEHYLLVYGDPNAPAPTGVITVKTEDPRGRP